MKKYSCFEETEDLRNDTPTRITPVILQKQNADDTDLLRQFSCASGDGLTRIVLKNGEFSS